MSQTKRLLTKTGGQHVFAHRVEAQSATPFIGVPVASAALPNLRRLALLQSMYFIFYDVAAEQVTVLRVWHMSRGGQPKLPKR